MALTILMTFGIGFFLGAIISYTMEKLTRKWQEHIQKK